MNPVSENLKNYHDAFINETNLYDFFIGLAGYVNYILEVPELRAIIESVENKKLEEYEKLTNLENESMLELRVSKNKLFKIIEDCNIKPDSLKHVTSLRSAVFETENVIDTIKIFEDGGLRGRDFDSDTLDNYLFDIAVGISKQGYQSMLRNFIIPNKKANNEYSNVQYSFSNALIARRDQVERIKKSQRLEMWGVLDRLVGFQKSYLEQCENTSFKQILEKYGSKAHNHLAIRDVVNIALGAEDIGKIINMRYGRTLDNDLFYLKLPDFKTYIKIAHPFLLKEISRLIIPDGSTSDFKNTTEFRIAKKGDDFYYKGDLRAKSTDADWYKVFCALFDLIPEGGEIAYTKLGTEIKTRIKKTRDYNDKDMRRFIQTNLTDKANGFMHYAQIPDNEDNGKPLLSVKRGRGIIFNNRLG